MTAAFASMLLADARLPTGSHTQSGGLEPALLDGMAVGSVPDYLAARLGTVVRVDAGVAVVAPPPARAVRRPAAGAVRLVGAHSEPRAAGGQRAARPRLAALAPQPVAWALRRPLRWPPSPASPDRWWSPPRPA